MHACALRSTGSIACWGDNSDGQATPPAGHFTAVSAGGAHTCALRSDGSIACWGDNSDGQASPPAGTDFTAVSAGNGHTCALRSDGSIACWGDNSDGQASPPAGTDFTAVSAGSIDTCAVKSDGSIACWGNNVFGQTDAPPVQTITFSAPPAHPVYGGSYVVSATATSGLPVSFSIDPSSTAGACSISGAAVSFTYVGTCVIDANQAGNAYFDSVQVQQTLKIAPVMPLAITSVSPISGSAAGGTPITIVGKGFVPGDKVVVGQGEGALTGAIAATAVSVDSPTQITATTGGPAKPGAFSLFVIGPDGAIATSPSRFTYTGGVTSMSPTSGSSAAAPRSRFTAKGSRPVTRS